MYKKTKNELNRLGLNGDKDRFYGALHGYETNVYLNLYGLFVNVSMYRTPEQENEIQHDLLVMKTRFINWQWNTYGITLSITDWTQKTMLKKLEGLLQSIYDIFAKHGALGVGYCPICGKELDFADTKKCLIEGNTVSIDNECVNKINAVISTENQQFDEKPNNYLRGFLGALIGGVAGAVVGIILYLIGFVSAISSFVAFFVGILLYKKFGGKPNKMMLVIVTATTFACMILSVFSIYLVGAKIALVEEGLEMSTFGAFKLAMQDEKIARSFWSDMALTVLFTVVGCVFEIVNNARKIKRQKNI